MLATNARKRKNTDNAAIAGNFLHSAVFGLQTSQNTWFWCKMIEKLPQAITWTHVTQQAQRQFLPSWISSFEEHMYAGSLLVNRRFETKNKIISLFFFALSRHISLLLKPVTCVNPKVHKAWKEQNDKAQISRFQEQETLANTRFDFCWTYPGKENIPLYIPCMFLYSADKTRQWSCSLKCDEGVTCAIYGRPDNTFVRMN